MADPRTSYDELPYPDYCFARTHPEHLFALSALCGRAAPPFATARVLEIGCARGANLLPMALDLPDATFVGVDPSVTQIAEARSRAEALGLRNVEFRAEGVGALAPGDPFDYVVCHGVYSWVPDAVRAVILDTCRTRLKPGGVAYVSFNALPGWNGLRTLRDFVLRHASEGTAAQRVLRARRALGVFAAALEKDHAPWAAWMRDELAELAEAEDAYLFHEYLEETNEAFYLDDFVARAEAHGLAFLADADPRVAAASLRPGGGDPRALAQSVDFTRNRRFRAALLVHPQTAGGRAEPASLARLWLATRVEAPAVAPAGEAPFTVDLDGRAVTLREPWMQRAVWALTRAAGRPVAFTAMAAAAGAALGLDPRSALVAAAARAKDMLELVFDGVVSLHAGPARYAAAAGALPRASALARLQAQRTDVVTTLRHTRIEVPDDPRAVLRLADGTRDRGALAAGLLRDARGEGERAARCADALDWLAANALLTA